MRRALLRCALALASLPAARSEGGGVDGLISNVIDTATPGLQKAVDLAPGININQADMDRFKAEKGKVDAVTTRVERFSQSRPLGKPGEGLDCVYRMRGAGLKAINQYRYTQLPDTGSPPVYSNGKMQLRLNLVKARWEACPLGQNSPCYYSSKRAGEMKSLKDFAPRERREERQVVVGQVAEARRDLPLRAVADRDARRRVEPAVGGDDEAARRGRRGRG